MFEMFCSKISYTLISLFIMYKVHLVVRGAILCGDTSIIKYTPMPFKECDGIYPNESGSISSYKNILFGECNISVLNFEISKVHFLLAFRFSFYFYKLTLLVWKFSVELNLLSQTILCCCVDTIWDSLTF